MDLPKYPLTTVPFGSPASSSTLNNIISEVEQNLVQIRDIYNSELYDHPLPEGTILMFDGAGWEDNVTMKNWYACIGGNVPSDGRPGAGLTIPDLVDKFMMGCTPANVGQTGGSNSHTLTISQMPTHDHGANTGINSAGHTHTQGSTGTVSADHTHSGTTSNPSANHTHSYTYPAIATVWCLHNSHWAATGNKQTGSVSAWHTHSFTTGGISTNHTHTNPTTSEQSANHTHAISSQGNGESFDKQPSFYSVIYIRKMAV